MSDRYKKQRIVFIDHSGDMGGGQNSLNNLLSKLSMTSRVILLSPGPLAARLQKIGIDVSIIENVGDLISLAKETSLLVRLCALRHLPGILAVLTDKAEWGDVIYVNSKKALIFGALVSRKLQRHLIWHQHDVIHVPRKLPLRGRLSEMLFVYLLNRYASRVICVSQACADTLIAAGGRQALTVVIHNGLDPERYGRSVDRAGVRRGAGLPEDVSLIGCFGRLTKIKGQRVLLEALQQLPNAHAVFVGGELFGESGYRTALDEQVEKSGLTGRVHFLGHREDVPELMRTMDVIAHPSTEFDSCPLVVIEALHSDVPLVATAVGGVPELVDDDVTGLLVPPNDSSALAKALNRILNDPSLGARLSAAGRQKALQAFTLERVVSEVTKVIQNI